MYRAQSKTELERIPSSHHQSGSIYAAGQTPTFKNRIPQKLPTLSQRVDKSSSTAGCMSLIWLSHYPNVVCVAKWELDIVNSTLKYCGEEVLLPNRTCWKTPAAPSVSSHFVHLKTDQSRGDWFHQSLPIIQPKMPKTPAFYPQLPTVCPSGDELEETDFIRDPWHLIFLMGMPTKQRW